MPRRRLSRTRAASKREGPAPADDRPPAQAASAERPRPRVTLIDYNADHVTEREVAHPNECIAFRNASSVTWVNVEGLSDPALIQELGKAMGFHALTVEDLLNVDQRPKMEDYGDYLYVVVKMLRIDQGGEVTIEQLSLVIGSSYVISFLEDPGDPFDGVRARIRNSLGRIRRAGADYLAYALLNVVLDYGFRVVDRAAERIEHLDELLSGNERPEIVRGMYQTKREIIHLRRAVAPMREVVGNLLHGESDLIAESTLPYLRDLYDHVVQAVERIDTSRDLLGTVQDLYLARISNRTNTVMKIIAVFSSIFLPLTFITGVFGMNFEFMPLLHRKWGFAVSALIMLGVVLGMLWYFRRRRWL